LPEYVVLVDEADRELGTVEKVQAHVAPVLHRAVSVIICDRRGSLLMQRRAATKYHSAGRWSNSCCGHPRPGEAADQAAARRLAQEMGIRCTLYPAGMVSYRLDVGDGLVEHELNRIFVGEYNARPHPDPEEISAWSWVTADALCGPHPEPGIALTAWFSTVMEAAMSLPGVANEPEGVRRLRRRWRALH
jgi:isopentenyl-diphosphate delta-isomerase